MTELISIWREHAPDERFGEFLAKCAVDQFGYDPDKNLLWHELERAGHSDILRWARERFGINA